VTNCHGLKYFNYGESAINRIMYNKSMKKHIKTTREEFENRFIEDDGVTIRDSVILAFIEKRERLLYKKIKKDVMEILDEELVTPLDIDKIGRVPDDEWKVLSIKRLEKRIKEL